MEPLTTAAIALGTAIAMKILEKTGENIGEAVHKKGFNFIRSLKPSSPDTTEAIEKASEQPLDYGKAVLGVETAFNQDQQVAQASQELLKAVDESKNEKLAQQIQEELKKIAEALRNQSGSGVTYNNTIEKLVNLAQGNATIHIEEQNITI